MNNQCAAHRAVATEQRFNDGLLWERHQVERLRAEEMGEQTTWTAGAPYRIPHVPQSDVKP